DRLRSGRRGSDRPGRRAAERGPCERPRTAGTGRELAEGNELPGAGRACRSAWRADREPYPAARSASSARICPRLAAAGTDPRAAPVVRLPVVGARHRCDRHMARGEHKEQETSRMNTTASDLRARNLRTIGLLAALFLLPLVASFWLYYGTGWRPAGTA